MAPERMSSSGSGGVTGAATSLPEKEKKDVHGASQIKVGIKSLQTDFSIGSFLDNIFMHTAKRQPENWKHVRNAAPAELSETSAMTCHPKSTLSEQFLPRSSLPGYGLSRTRSRNRRRRLRKKLNALDVIWKNKGHQISAPPHDLIDKELGKENCQNPERKERAYHQPHPGDSNAILTPAGRIQQNTFIVSSNSGTSDVDLNTEMRSLSTNSWNTKIILSAVECVGPYHKLSSPPFPFVQGWHGFKEETESRKKLKRKRKAYGNSSDDEATDLDSNRMFGLDASNETTYDGTRETELQGEKIARSSLNETQRLSRATRSNVIDDHNTARSTETSSSSWQECKFENCKPGAVIAFKQLWIAAETNWQPEISKVRIATIDRVFEEGQMLEMTLEQPSREYVEYDAEGQRILGRFEMPRSPSEQLQTDDGYIELAFHELIEPSILENKELAEP